MFKLAISNLFRRKTRTFLSLIGIIIGTASIITLVSVVDGVLYDVQGAIGEIQQVTVLEAGANGPLFSQIDMSFKSDLERMPGIKKVTPTYLLIANSVEGKPVDFVGFETIRIIGTDYRETDSDTAAGIGGEIIKGRGLKSGDRGSVVIGEGLADKHNKFVGNTIKIDDKKFRIIGIYKTGSDLFNSSALFTIEDVIELRNLPSDKVSSFYLDLDNPDDDTKIAELINFRFKEDLTAVSSSDFSATFGDLLEGVRLMVIAVAAISAIVAGVGIINTMLMSVIERYKEIGALKATGWTDNNIMRMIVIESALIGVIGGLIGMSLGVLGGIVLREFAGLSTLVTLELGLQAFAFAVIVGIIGGLYPAWMASKLDPVEVLRME